VESENWLSRWRDDAGNNAATSKVEVMVAMRKHRGAVGMKEQPTLRFSLRCEAGRRLCFRDRTQHTLSVWSFLPP
jgi:hypothetical protein